jgi:type IV secretory pathway VirB2 component (pilin)
VTQFEYDRRIVTNPARNLMLGGGVAAGLAIIAIVPTIAGVDTWKWALGVLGIVLFVLAATDGPSGRRDL